MTRVLVTGGAGFIGSHVVDALADAGHDVRVVDRLHPRAHDGPPDHVRSNVDHRWDDLADPAVAAAATDGVDVVCHQAAMVGLGVDFDDVGDYVRDNDVATASLLGGLHRRGFAGRIILASSMVVYGEGRYRCAEHGLTPAPPRSAPDLDAGRYEPRCPECGIDLIPEPVPETAATDPRNVYAATKLHQEHLCRAYAREHPGTTVTALRYHNVYGARMPRDTPYAGVAAIFKSALESGRAPRVLEDGGQRRDFIDVRDVARANVLALTTPHPVDGALNVATGRPHTVLEMATALADAMGGPRPEVVGGHRPGDVRHVFASAERASQTLGFDAEIEFGTGMTEFATAPLR
jgi:dTDP-L-rhamnose 4-epimerase